VRLNWKVLRLGLVSAMLLMVAGCGGIRASKSISPATFLLPGLLEADPPPVDPNHYLPAEEPTRELARL
jgi:hypothetical protein